jgi:hypothetical protein
MVLPGMQALFGFLLAVFGYMWFVLPRVERARRFFG